MIAFPIICEEVQVLLKDGVGTEGDATTCCIAVLGTDIGEIRGEKATLFEKDMKHW